ncbi:MFS transporter [Massilia horti]|uniref:MFS transporter n=1 Tax=Massilia horti TaxID=2562153 RepID=A0A4Y9T2R9_9BURK|nr:MFS transporter [Massilia horti]TFW31340.1 MFS transporter [Massilia horti]
MKNVTYPQRTAVATARPKLALASLSLAMLLPSLGTSIANIALPTLAEVFGAPFQHIQWIILAYLLAITTSLVSAGRFGDLVGRRRVVLAGIGLFMLGSVFCATANVLAMLVAARALQGFGAAIMMALTMALATEAVPKNRIGSAMGMLATMSAVGTALGPSLGGLLIASYGWQSIFLINVPLGLATFVLAYVSLPRTRPAQTRNANFDYAGTLVLAVTLTAYAVAMTLGRGRFGLVNACLLVLAVLGTALFVRVERKAQSPLISLAVLRMPQTSGNFVMSGLIATVIMATLVVGPFYLSGAMGLPPAQVGLVMSTGPFAAAVIGIPAGRLVDRLGAPFMTRVGLSAMVAGTLGLAILPAEAGIQGYVAALVTITAGYGLFQAANNTAVMAGVAPEQRGVISGVLTLSRNLGLISGASLMGALFSFGSGMREPGRAAPAALATGLHVTMAAATLLIVVAIVIARRIQVSGSTGPTSSSRRRLPTR